MQRIIITGAAGFIGFHLSKRLCGMNRTVLGIDNLNDYYDVQLKYDRLKELQGVDSFRFEKSNIADTASLNRLFFDFNPDAVVNLAAQAGVRYSMDNPAAYGESNVTGFLNILEACRQHGVKHLVYASSSSVYGANTKLPYSVLDNVDHPVSLYAATKKANELMAHTYAHLYGLPCTGLRFFTVYGPWGRPDMAYYKFTKAMYADEPIPVYNNGAVKRDFTYIDDIIEGLVRIIDIPAAANKNWSGDRPDPSSSTAPYRLYNIGNQESLPISDMIETLEREIGVKAKKNLLPMQPGDVVSTHADIKSLEEAIGFKPATPFKKGLAEFVRWYRGYYKLNNGPAS